MLAVIDRNKIFSTWKDHLDVQNYISGVQNLSTVTDTNGSVT